MFKIHKDVRRLTDLEKKQYDVDGYVTGLPVFSEEAADDLDNLFYSLTSRLDKSISLVGLYLSFFKIYGGSFTTASSISL